MYLLALTPHGIYGTYGFNGSIVITVISFPSIRQGVWGSVCDDNFGPEDGTVVCRMLGFEGSTARVFSEAAFGEGDGPIWIQGKSTDNLKSCHHCTLQLESL